MANFNWDDYEKVPEAKKNTGAFNWDDYEHVPTESPSSSPVTSATTGMIEGAVPFARSIAGAGRASMNAITGVTGPLAGGSLEDIAEDYRNARDQFARESDEAAKANPKTAFVGNIAGGVFNPLFKEAQGASGMAGASAVHALGRSDADLTKNELGKAALDTGVGALAGAGGYYGGKAIGKGLEKGLDGVKWAGKKALTNLGPTAEAIKARLKSKAQDSAKSFPALAEDMAETLKNLSQQISEADGNAWSKLSSENDIHSKDIVSHVDDAVNSLNVKGGSTLGSASKNAKKVLNEIKNDIAELVKSKTTSVVDKTDQSGARDIDLNQLSGVLQPEAPNFSEADVKSAIQKLDENINWEDESLKPTNTILEKLRTNIDGMLKDKNPDYAEAMMPVAEKTGLLNNTKRLFNIKGKPGQGLTPTDTTAGKIKSSLREDRQVTQDVLEQLKRHTGKDYSDLAQDYQHAKKFQLQSPNASSKKVNIGAGAGIGIGATIGGLVAGPVGAGIGGAIGGGIGASAGGAMDVYGGRAAAKIIDTYLKTGNRQLLGKFAPVIDNAAKKDPQTLAVVISILSKNPEFRKMINSSAGGSTPYPKRSIGSE